MRLLLDHNLSARRIGRALRAAGHDVRALQEELESEGMADPDVLALAAAEGRILVTRNSRHFAPLARTWAELGRPHGGLILIWSLDHGEFASIVAAIEACLEAYPLQDQWRDLVLGV